MKENDSNISPVGWYVGSYLIRFIEVEDKQNEEEKVEFLWVKGGVKGGVKRLN
jgi:hypothetical protein